jgi:hypothetical protein
MTGCTTPNCKASRTWDIWNERNTWVFRNKQAPPTLIFEKVKKEIKVWASTEAKRLGKLMPVCKWTFKSLSNLLTSNRMNYNLVQSEGEEKYSLLLNLGKKTKADIRTMSTARKGQKGCHINTWVCPLPSPAFFLWSILNFQSTNCRSLFFRNLISLSVRSLT